MEARQFRAVRGIVVFAGMVAVGVGVALSVAAQSDNAKTKKSPEAALVAEGKEIFRFDTFGDERLWTDQLGMHTVVETSVDPTTALTVGLKVDADVLPKGILEKVDLKSPATTVELLKLNAVVGIKATVDAENHITRLGVTCALCHSTVDDSVMKGIGKRMDGWPNRDLDVGKIIALSPAIDADKKRVYNSWGPGKYDPRFNIDGKNTPLVLPPAYGLAKIKNETYTAEGPISYWNAYVAVTQMGGQGHFSDPALGINIALDPDLVTSKLPALAAYQHSLEAPPPPANSYDVAAAQRGRTVFNKNCMSCHVGVDGTDNNGGNKLHAPEETGMDGAYAARTKNKAYRTTPLRALWQHPPYFHDGKAETLDDVVAHYNKVRKLDLGDQEQDDLVEFLKSR